MTDTMTAQTKSEALEASILHWQENVKADTWGEVRMWLDDCALCDLYCSNCAAKCKGCPVMDRTGESDCSKTPYRAAGRALRAWKYTDPDDKTVWLAARDEFRRCAQAELDFLISLRETE